MSNKKLKCMECGVKMTKQDIPQLYSLCRRCKRIIDVYKDLDIKIDISKKEKRDSQYALENLPGLKLKGGK